MTTKDKTKRAHLSTAGSGVRLKLVTNNTSVHQQRVHAGCAGARLPAEATPLKSKSPLVHTMTAYADAIDRQLAALMND
ncbi:MAG: hypothetical protein FJ146_14010 [Deltaproteobacteria bacterium]|nr:hypothetical protein [Deltaproteobacteria bacterium]